MKKIILMIILIFCMLLIFPLYLKNKEERLQLVEGSVKQMKISSNITLFPSLEMINLEQYLVGVIAAEMPISYHIEALKAQAVAARTYALHTTNLLSKPIQTTTANQVYFPVNNLNKARYEKIMKAVNETFGQVLMMDNEIIIAMFHAASNGMTESAFNYSGKEYEYLQSVVSPEKKEQQFTYSLNEISNKLNTTFTLNDVEQYELFRNSTNRVEQIIIAQKQFSGREVREKLNLPSTDFQLKVLNNEIVITTKGYGHGVGLSQMGANLLAQQNYTYEEILSHYYKGAEIIKVIYE